jgi:hypothetical protein
VNYRAVSRHLSDTFLHLFGQGVRAYVATGSGVTDTDDTSYTFSVPPHVRTHAHTRTQDPLEKVFKV